MFLVKIVPKDKRWPTCHGFLEMHSDTLGGNLPLWLEVLQQIVYESGWPRDRSNSNNKRHKLQKCCILGFPQNSGCHPLTDTAFYSRKET